LLEVRVVVLVNFVGFHYAMKGYLFLK
jgi:hypothetical protein